jgi:sugar/nucleoside kinase (ribokinase family)
VEGEIDFCGTGDSFQAGLACAMAAGLPLAEAAIIANACAAVTIRKLHTTGTASRKELEAQLLEN